MLEMKPGPIIKAPRSKRGNSFSLFKKHITKAIQRFKRGMVPWLDWLARSWDVSLFDTRDDGWCYRRRIGRWDGSD